MFFQAISRLTHLKVLALPQWELFVQQESLALVPLRQLDLLKLSVHEYTKHSTAGAIVPGLRFFRADSHKFRA